MLDDGTKGWCTCSASVCHTITCCCSRGFVCAPTSGAVLPAPGQRSANTWRHNSRADTRIRVISRIPAQTEAYLLLDLCTETLVDRLSASHEGRLPEPAALAAFTAVCEAVAIMHAQLPPIAHRRAVLSTAR